MYKKYYSRFLAAQSPVLHFACHSHHYWPDVTRDAHIKYWDDSAKYVDDKWGHFFSNAIPKAQSFIAKNLNLSSGENIVFAPNTHEFVFRLLSQFLENKTIKILTTDSEFYSFDRQINRLSEWSHVEVIKVPTQPFATFSERFIEAAQKTNFDLIFFSHVFFNSGFACDIDSILMDLKKGPHTIVVDGYHSFMALPIDFKSHEDRVFFLAGSYKYAQGGEGGCFLHVPHGTSHRPAYTGWFAELAHLDNVSAATAYPTSAMQYAGSTMDYSAIYRLNAALELFAEDGITPAEIHAHIRNLQRVFIEEMKKNSHPLLNESTLLYYGENLGHFLTFELPSANQTKEIVDALKDKHVITDSRGNRLRFGFGLYLSEEDIRKACALIFKNKAPR